MHFDVLKPYKGTRRPRWLRGVLKRLELRRAAETQGVTEKAVRAESSSNKESVIEMSDLE